MLVKCKYLDERKLGIPIIDTLANFQYCHLILNTKYSETLLLAEYIENLKVNEKEI